MPLKRCDGGWKWGDEGKCCTAKAEAIKQGIALEGAEKFHKIAAEQLDIADLDLIIEVAYLSGMDIDIISAISRDMDEEWRANADFIYEDTRTGEKFRFKRQSVKKKDGRTLRFVGKA